MQLLGEKNRITILTDRLIRLEYSEQGYFEDSPTFAVVNRNFGDDPEINVNDDEDDLTVETKYLFLSYDKKQFSSIGLLIKLKSMMNVIYIAKLSIHVTGKLVAEN